LNLEQDLSPEELLTIMLGNKVRGRNRNANKTTPLPIAQKKQLCFYCRKMLLASSVQRSGDARATAWLDIPFPNCSNEQWRLVVIVVDIPCLW